MINNGDKLVKLEIHFRMSDSVELTGKFSDDVNIILDQILKYRLSEKNHDKQHKYDSNKTNYENFWNMISTTDRVLLLGGWISEWDGKNLKDINQSI